MNNKEDFDLNFDENGNIKLTDSEAAMEKIRQDLLGHFRSYVGQPIKSEGAIKETFRKALKKSIDSVLDQLGLVKSHHPISVKTRWENMGWRARLEWRFMKIFFPNRVREMQAVVNSHNYLVHAIMALNELTEEAGLELESPPYETRDYPNWCHPNPRSVFDMETQIQLIQPIEYVTVDLVVPVKKENI